MVLSFLFFSKPFTMQYVWSGFLILFGIALNVYSKNRQTIDAAVLKQYHLYVRHWTRQKPKEVVEMV
jgi:adenosine 3'-phospho 5'-phosphosulfate transporter B3